MTFYIFKQKYICIVVAVFVSLQEHMAAVLKDSKVLSVLEKKRGDKGYRELQGDKLRELFVDVISKEVVIY